MRLKADLPKYAKKYIPPARYKVCYGGRGGARSWTFARLLLIIAAQRPVRILCAREMQKSIEDSVHKLLVDQIQLMGLPGFTVTQREIRHVNGSLFIFAGLRYNITKIKSMEGVDYCWVEEAERVSKESWDVLIPTIRKPGSEIWITFNPDQEEDPTYQRFVVRPPPNAIVLKVNWKDNPWFPEELREEKDYLYLVDPEAAEWVWGGETRTTTESQILRGKWVVESFMPHESWKGPYFGLDFGFANDPTALVKLWIAPSVHPQARKMRLPGRLMVEYEAFRVGLDLHKTIPFLHDKVPGGIHKHVIRADSARPESISYLQQHGLPRITKARKWPGSIEDGIAHLRKYEQIVIHPRCTNFKQEARLYSYKVDQQTGEVLPIIVDRHNNGIDAARYALSPIILAGKAPRSGYRGSSYRNTA